MYCSISQELCLHIALFRDKLWIGAGGRYIYPTNIGTFYGIYFCSITKIFDNISFGIGFQLLGFYFPDYEKRNAVMSVGIIATHLCNSCKFLKPQNVNFLLISHSNGLFLCKYHFISYTEELEWISDSKNDIFVYRLIWQHNITP